jgi:hypothetical protein
MTMHPIKKIAETIIIFMMITHSVLLKLTDNRFSHIEGLTSYTHVATAIHIIMIGQVR